MVNPIPEGTHTVTPHLVVRGGDRAIEFYKQAFGAVEVTRMASPDGTVMHAELRIGDSLIYLADENPAWGALSPLALGGSPVSIHLYVPDADASFQRAIQAGATVRMPLSDAFWGDRYGQVGDPFGHVWSVATHVEDVSPEEMERRAREAFASGPSAGSEAEPVGAATAEPEPEPSGGEVPRRSAPRPAARREAPAEGEAPAGKTAKKTAKKAVKKSGRKKPARKAAAKKSARKKPSKKKSAKRPAKRTSAAKKKTAKKKTAKKKTAKKKVARKKATRKTSTGKKAGRKKASKKASKKVARKKPARKKTARRKTSRGPARRTAKKKPARKKASAKKRTTRRR